MALAIGLSLISAWAIFPPIIIGIVLRNNLNNLSKSSFLVEYGLFYVGLRDKMYFWEVGIVNLRKITFIMLSTLL